VFEVYRELGHGFLEKVYERALLLELQRQGLSAVVQSPIRVRYKGEEVGDYVADIIVEDPVLLELKAQEKLTQAHTAQVLNYLKATGIRVGLLVNFSYPKADIVRLVL
jgi:GxxExxY protein